uniref:Putative nucleoporin 50 kDa n=1 Tax=Panstrongylus megistus TaxID=65343 RepID=A0A069DU58_9HEMI
MPKRAATNELNHFNWNQEEEPEEECTTPKIASPEVLSNRVIRTAKRFTSSTSSAPSKSAFSNFTGFGCPSNTTSSDVKTTFSFLSGANISIFSNTNGISAQKTEQTGKEDTQDNKINSVNTDNEYLSKLKGLNETVLEWIKIHVGKNPTCILTPIFNDYEKYLKEIQNEKQSKKLEEKTEQPVTVSSTSLPASSQKPYFTNSLFSSTNNETTKSKLTTLSNDTSSASLIPRLNPISNSLCSKADSNIPSIFSTPVGSSASTGDNKQTSSVFGSSSFSCANIAVPAPITSNTDDNDNEEDDPPKNVFERVTEEDAVFSQRIKLFLKKEDNFVDNGVGTLYIRPVDEEGSKYQAIVRADTNLGNILLNIILKDSVPSKRVGKNNVMIVCILEVNKKMKPVPVLLRVKTESEADHMLEQINKYKK